MIARSRLKPKSRVCVKLAQTCQPHSACVGALQTVLSGSTEQRIVLRQCKLYFAHVLKPGHVHARRY